MNNNSNAYYCERSEAIQSFKGLDCFAALAMTTSIRKQNGFTLIELMLVLALIAMIIAFSVGVYQSQMLNFNIDKTSMQLQQWLEGARAYYVNSGAQNNGTYTWPVASSAACTTNALLEGNTGACQQLPNPAQVFILPNTLDTSPWGVNSPYTFIGAVHPNTANGSIFEVDVTVPATVANAQIVAQRIASRLPSATVTGTTVSAFAAVPALATNSNPNFMIAYISQVACSGMFNQGSKSNPPPICGEVPIPTNCPPNTKPQPYLSLGGTPTAPSDLPEQGGVSILQPYPAVPSQDNGSYIKNLFLTYKVDSSGKNWIPMIGIANTNYPGKYANVSYWGNILVIAACVSNTQANPALPHSQSVGNFSF